MTWMWSWFNKSSINPNKNETLKIKDVGLLQKGLESNYYDQSHFIREIKKLTHHKPRYFFNQISYETTNPWLIA